MMINLINKYQTPIKFSIVGATGVIVNIGFLYFFTEYLKIFYIISAFIAIEISILSNFILNDNWTFKTNKNKPFIERLISYETICLLGVGIQICILYIFTDILGIYYLISNLLAIPITVSWNFIMNKYITWKK
jgi:dolichol-phosphate mannosyltransferase